MLLKYPKIYYTRYRIKYGDSMKNRYKFSLLVIAILLAFSMTVGTSYAFWSTTHTQTGTNDVVAGCLKIEVNDLDVDGLSTSINLTNTYPKSDVLGLQSKPYTLTITNVCDINASYTISLNTLSSSILTEGEIKYHFIKTSPTETFMTPALINTMKELEINSEIAAGIDGEIHSSYELVSGVLNGQVENVTDSVTYNLRLWIDDDASNSIMESTYKAAIAVYAVASN